MSASNGTRAHPLATLFLALSAFLPIQVAQAQDNGIHVGAPKVYDARALQLMMDELAKSLQKTNFVDPKALAAALGNVQGYRADDFSQALNVSGAAGPQAASVFAAAGGTGAAAPAAATPATAATAPTVSITVAPTLNSGAATPAASAPSGYGPQAPALPTLQTGPTYNPNFGPSGGDLLADETNLTYQLFNLRMMLERSLSDRLYDHGARLQAVLGFDIDIEPDSAARDAAAIVDVTVAIECHGLADCNPSNGISIVALMPEEGSHNAATLSQKASSFGGALVASVFSVGYSAQKRSQVFYLYRDMDTLSFEDPAPGGEAHFGWQFRPVLGRRAVASGKRHLLVVLALPAPDQLAPAARGPELVVRVNTSWKRYDGKLQTTFGGHPWSHTLPGAQALVPPFHVPVPTTAASQADLEPQINHIKWVPTDATNGVAIVTGSNFFPGTTVRFGNKTYSGAADGLVIKSDQELEVAVSSATAALGGLLSGRYGAAKPLVADAGPLRGFYVADLYAQPTGNFLYNVDVTLKARPDANGNVRSFASVLDALGPPYVSLNGAPVTLPNFSLGPDVDELHVQFSAPAAAFSAGAAVGATFPFGGITWARSMTYYDTTLKVARLSGEVVSRLVITATNPAASLCDGWKLILDPQTSFSNGSGLSCMDKGTNTLALDIKSDDLKKYNRFVLTKDGRAPLGAEIPKSDAPSPAPELDNGQKVAVQQNDLGAIVTFTGKHLDKVTKALLDKAELQVVQKAAGKIVLSLPKEVTDKPRTTVVLQLLSDGNDPVLATFTVTPIPAPKGK